MCQLFIQADPDLWASRTKSLRIDGVATSIRMEAFFWHTLEEIAERDGLSVNQLIKKLYYESIVADHDLGNFTSFLRVCAGRYLSMIVEGDIDRDMERSISTFDSSRVLAAEKSRQLEGC